MGLTKIEWAHYTFNPWIGCTKQDELCTNCYAERDDKFRGWTQEGWGKGKPRTRTSEANWRKPLLWDAEAASRPWLRCSKCAKVIGPVFFRDDCQCGGRLIRQRPRVFCASLADVFDEEVDDKWRWDLLDLIKRTPNLDWLLLTKRTAKAAAFLRAAGVNGVADPNVWVGASVGTQRGWDERVADLLRIPAAVRFLSMEPLLERVEMRPIQYTASLIGNPFGSRKAGSLTWPIDWVIAGGESGAKARPTHPDWVRSLRDDCARHGVPFFFKQWGEWAPTEKFDWKAKRLFLELDGSDSTDWDISRHSARTANMQRVGKQAAGRLLDGVEHSAIPAPAARSATAFPARH